VRRIRHLPSPALTISVLALIVAVGGSSYVLASGNRQKRVIVRVSRRVANRRIRKLAPRLSVNHANTAATAGAAGTATTAGHADSADTATLANHAYTAYHDGEVKLHASTFATVGTLHIPEPGAYVVLAKLFVNNHDGGIEYASGVCELVAPGATDQTDFTVGPTFDTVTEAISLQVTPVLSGPADVNVRCEYNSQPPSTTVDINADWQKITAIQVAGRTTTGF
jgi:hypothetical protein